MFGDVPEFPSTHRTYAQYVSAGAVAVVPAPSLTPSLPEPLFGKFRRRLTEAQLERRRAWGREWGPLVGASIRAYIKENT